MIADCETCERKDVPCSACQESQRAICFICQGDVADPYCELEYTQNTAAQIARDMRLGIFPQKSKATETEEYIARLRAYADEGGQLSHRNGLFLLKEVERLQGLVPRYLGGTRT